MKASELISALVETIAEDGDREVMLSLTSGDGRISPIDEIYTSDSWTIWLRDKPPVNVPEAT